LRIYNVLTEAPKTRGICDEDGAALILRQDDTEAVLHQRLKAYDEITSLVISHYRGAWYFQVDADCSPAEVFGAIARLLEPSPRWARRFGGILALSSGFSNR